EDPYQLLAQLDSCFARLEQLVVQINRTNDRILIGSQTLTALLARRDMLKARISILRDTAYAASQAAQRATHTEIKILPTLRVRDLQKEIDQLSRQLRETDNAIQAANWTNELMEV
ncbi:MAG: DIP1984 family protein, partial [bacterium]|nr:DIP1984 family protein [bacterium]